MTLQKEKIVSIYKDIIHIYLTGHYDLIPVKLKEHIFPVTLKGKIQLIAEIIIGPFLRYFKYIFEPSIIAYNRKQHFSNKIWLYIGSKNNYDSIKFIDEDRNDTVFIGGYQDSLKTDRWENIYCAHRFKYLHRFFFIKKHLKKQLCQANDNYLYMLGKSLGYYENWSAIIQLYKPKAIVFSNDHRFDQRALLLAAKTAEIPTVYIQHASITENFPPLKFDLSLLEGEDTFNKYRNIGEMDSRVKLIGMPKFDDYFSDKNKNSSINSIGISISLVDDLSKVEQLIFDIKKHLPNIEIYLRPHPAELRNLRKIIPFCVFSDSKKEGVFEYLKKIDFQIASISSIHLEAILLNIPSVFYELSDKFKTDLYGYFESGLIMKFNKFETLFVYIKSIIDNKPDVSKSAKRYNHVVGTKYEGKSKELAISMVNDLLMNMD